MKYVLLVTWFLAGQPPSISSYQTTFNSVEACETARTTVLAEGRRLEAEALQRAIAAHGDNQNARFFAYAPTVTAVCAAQ